MKNPIFLITTGLIAMATAGQVLAGPQCTLEPKTKWVDAGAFQSELKAQGYQIKVFKVTKGNCYEIYGRNKSNKKVEIYFNPVDKKIVKQEVRG